MGLVLRHLLPAAIVAVAVALTAGLFVFARPQYRPHQGTTIHVPGKRPAADAPGRAGWTWPDGVPGWQPGESIDDYDISQVQPVETQPAALAAAHAGLDASRLAVVDAMHLVPGAGPLAIFAAPYAEATPTSVCLAVALPASDDVRWRCDLASSRVLLGVVSRRWTANANDGRRMFALVGLARGDVRRVELGLPGTSTTLYDRGRTWGQFDANVLLRSPGNTPVLRVYGDHGLVRTLRLRLAADEQRVIAVR